MESVVSADPNIIILLVLGYNLLDRPAEADYSFSLFRLIKSHLRSWLADTGFSDLQIG